MTTVTGTGAALRFQLRRDRLRLPLWVAGVPMFALYFSVAITVVTDHGTELGSFAPILGNPVTMLVGGPGYGYDHITVPRMIAGVYLLYLMLAAAVLGMTTVIRHTRVDERTGRASLLPDRPGSAVAPGWVRTVPALVWRLQRTGVMGWAVSLAIGGLVFGLFADTIGGGADDLPSTLTDLLGGRDGLVDGYLGFMGLFSGLAVTAYALLEVQDLAGHEKQGFTATVLATGVGRMRWYLSWAGVRAVTVVLLLGLASLGEGSEQRWSPVAAATLCPVWPVMYCSRRRCRCSVPLQRHCTACARRSGDWCGWLSSLPTSSLSSAG
ncbi:hypothetical protein [Corynebacterium variabile]|uniref:hypothetical protein n=2 Tax=Corynebacterium variabile TaxID=1727 RepID=UPI0002001051|nr:hypothetical protein [Corynebacterium variabile]